MESAVTFLTTVSPCEYLPDRMWQLRYEVVPHLQPADYMQRLQQGSRTSTSGTTSRDVESMEYKRKFRLSRAAAPRLTSRLGMTSC